MYQTQGPRFTAQGPRQSFLTSSQTPQSPASRTQGQAAREGSDSRSVGRSVSISILPKVALEVGSKFRVSADLGQWKGQSILTFPSFFNLCQYIYQSVTCHVAGGWQLPRIRNCLSKTHMIISHHFCPEQGSYYGGLQLSKWEQRLTELRLQFSEEKAVGHRTSPGFRLRFKFLLALCPCMSYFTSLCLNFLICKMGFDEDEVHE